MTTVEFLESEMQKLFYIAKSNKVKFDELIEQAKEMEKEQIKDAYFNGRYEADKIVMGHNFYAEQYYKQTFKSE